MTLLARLRPAPQEPEQRPDRRRRVLIIVAAAVVVVVGLTWLVAFSSVFGVRSIDVRGAHVLTAAQVRAVADIENGTPLVRVDTAAVTRRVERLPEVESAQVSTSFPSTVVISIEERVPVGFVRRGDRVVLVDHTGAEYRTVRARPHGLPRFSIPGGRAGQETAAAVADVAAALPVGIRRQVRSIDALDPRSITLALRGGRVVRWGTAERTEDKARLLPALLRGRPSVVDLTNPDQPYTR